MVQLKQFVDTTKARLDYGMIQSDQRPYLGMSGIGHSCNRFLWFSFRWAFEDSFSQRLGRLFARGHREESVIVKDLERIGITCWGDQTECVMVNGHVKGHCDGICKNVPEAPKTNHLLEFKTMNDKSFKDTVKKGVARSKPTYYAQLQLYMKGLKLTRALFICVNKNDDSYYVERVRYDAQVAAFLIEKARSVVEALIPIPAPYSRTWFECKWCNAKDICHGNAQLSKNCRTCSYTEPVDDGIWLCGYHDHELSTEGQKLACEHYKMIKI